jgi:triosephosphate isomerase
VFYCAGNWKLNKSPSEAKEFVQTLMRETTPEEQGNLVILPPALSAYVVAEATKVSQVRWGGQNCYFENSGAFTGENSPAVLAQMGAKFCLVGHSERRQVFCESDEMFTKKVASVQAQNMIPILCVGETLDDRRWRRTKEVIGRQLKSGLASVDAEKEVWVAYEPVWAIGTGQVATPDQVEEAHTFLRDILSGLLGARATQTPILYGGSVKADNASGLRALNNVNGFLIGGASLDLSQFLKIYRTAL